HGATVTWGELPSVMAHRSQLNQILENLVGNALKFARHDVAPVITVTAARAGGMWDFAVADNGIGIEPQYFETIFVVFKRLHTEAAYPGSGIGLAICKRIVERHGGRIWVDSTLGQGSCFHFTILAAGTGE
ncbi:MAG TPA: ATP-binding protein, partial [Patescibacteria group bacterium]|nr:ATP-binding protein [Patescibacteria group bacterium]